MNQPGDKDREVWRRYWTFWYEQRQQEADAAKRLAEEYGAIFPSSSCADIARILQQRRPMRGLRSDEVVEAVPVWAFADTPEHAPVPESGLTESGWTPIQQINAARQEVETGGVSSHGPGPQAVTDEESTVPAPAAPSTPQPEAPTPRTDAAAWNESGGPAGWVVTRDFARQLERELVEKDSRLAGILFSGALDEVKCGDLQRWRDEFKAKQSASSARATHWEDEARRYAQNADFWREKYESARSSSTETEGYPGIAHDFETMRTALQQIARDRELYPRTAEEIAAKALRDITPRSATASSGSDNSER